MMRELGKGKQTEKLDDEMSSDTFWFFIIRVSLRIVSSSLSVKFLVYRNLKYVENFGLFKYHTNRLIEGCGWICYLHLFLIVHSSRLFLSKKQGLPGSCSDPNFFFEQHILTFAENRLLRTQTCRFPLKLMKCALLAFMCFESIHFYDSECTVISGV